MKDVARENLERDHLPTCSLILFFSYLVNIFWVKPFLFALNKIYNVANQIRHLYWFIKVATSQRVFSFSSHLQKNAWNHYPSTLPHSSDCLFSFSITITLFFHHAFCNPYFGPDFFSGSQTDHCFQKKNSGCRLTGQLGKQLTDQIVISCNFLNMGRKWNYPLRFCHL